LIASLSEQANNIPSLSRRSVLTSSEIANPYHMGYYRQIQERTYDLMAAQYSDDLSEIKEFIQKYDIDFWLVDANAFKASYVENNSWLRQIEPTASEAIAILNQGEKPVLSSLVRPCNVLRTKGRIVLDATCILETSAA